MFGDNKTFDLVLNGLWFESCFCNGHVHWESPRVISVWQQFVTHLCNRPKYPINQSVACLSQKLSILSWILPKWNFSKEVAIYLAPNVLSDSCFIMDHLSPPICSFSPTRYESTYSIKILLDSLITVEPILPVICKSYSENLGNNSLTIASFASFWA